LCDRVVTALAQHYRNDRQVIGWQIDNEFNCHMSTSYAPSDTLAFRIWLRDRYHMLGELNDAWGTRFWSQTYSDWDQIDLPHPTSAPANPSQLLDESRFISDCIVDFAARQAAILRRANPKWFVTHNGLFENVDGPELVKELDFFSHDQYPLFHGDWTASAAQLAQARSLSFPFAVLEQQSGPGGQMTYLHRTPRTGEMRLWALQSVAHGAKTLCFFRWRTCPYGAEQHWHGILDSDDKPNRRSEEATELGRDLRNLPDDYFDAPVLKSVALMRDFDNETNDRRINTYTAAGSGELDRWYAELSRRHVPVDMVWRDSDLTGYRVLIAPHLKMIEPVVVGHLRRLVEAGGTLIIGAQSGTKDHCCHSVQSTPPGLLTKLAGIEIEDWTMLNADESRDARLVGGPTLSLGTFVERLRLRGARPIAHWTGDDALLADAPAITCNAVGEGAVWYVGGYCPPGAVATLVDVLIGRRIVLPLVDADESVEVVARVGKRQTYLTLLNHSAAPRRVHRGAAVPSDVSFPDAGVEVPRFGVCVVTLKRSPQRPAQKRIRLKG
ncbi:MAG: beta-galactosidase, partial [Tepidisphaeraceae bacterium]